MTLEIHLGHPSGMTPLGGNIIGDKIIQNTRIMEARDALTTGLASCSEMLYIYNAFEMYLGEA